MHRKTESQSNLSDGNYIDGKLINPKHVFATTVVKLHYK